MELYNENLKYSIVDIDIFFKKTQDALKEFMEPTDKSQEFIRSSIISGIQSKQQNVELPDTIFVDGLPNTFSETQRTAVQKALKDRLSLI